MQNTSKRLPWSTYSNSRGYDKPRITFLSTWPLVLPEPIHILCVSKKAGLGSILYLNELGNNLCFLYRMVNAERGTEGIMPQKQHHEGLRYHPGQILRDRFLATTSELHFFLFSWAS